MAKKGDASSVVSVFYEDVEGWHRFTSPQMPGFCVIVEPPNYAAAVADIPEAIRVLYERDFKTTITITQLKTFMHHGPAEKPPVLHFAIEV